MPTVKRAAGAKSPARAPSKKASPAGSAEIAPGGTGTKKLIVAEKPSVAADIARALGGFTKQGDYFESDDYVLSSAVGHLLEIAAPEEYEVKRGKWSFANLPVCHRTSI
jgi:hypothetical protein